MDNQRVQFDISRINGLDIVEVAKKLNISIHKSGVNYNTTCLWHEDSHPSLILYNRQGNQHCHCYSCGAHHSVIDLAMQTGGWSFKEACQWLCNQFGISTTAVSGYVPPIINRPVQRQKKTVYSYIPSAMVDQLVSTESSLCRCLMHMAHQKDAWWTPEAVKWQVEEYRLGCYALWDYYDYTVFPCIDYLGHVCNLKVQHYDANPQSARFAHDDKGQSYMLASMWLKEGKLKYEGEQKPEKIVFRNDCLFGEHLLNSYPSSKVALVESPKNAIFGALTFPEMLWMAAGNKTNLNRRVLETLRDRDVMVFPDRDAIPEWTDKLKGMTDLANFSISDFCERYAPKDQMKFDIADYIQAKHHRIVE